MYVPVVSDHRKRLLHRSQDVTVWLPWKPYRSASLLIMVLRDLWISWVKHGFHGEFRLQELEQSEGLVGFITYPNWAGRNWWVLWDLWLHRLRLLRRWPWCWLRRLLWRVGLGRCGFRWDRQCPGLRLRLTRNGTIRKIQSHGRSEVMSIV